MKVIHTKKGQQIIVDDSDFESLSRFKWYVNGGYAGRTAKNPLNDKPMMILMHREILCLSFGNPLHGDHRDGNTLNNQRENLRIATNSQNQCNRGPCKTNTSGYKGVTWNKRSNKWQAAMKFQGTNMLLGTSDDPQIAYALYVEAARRLHGEFSYAGLEIEDKNVR